MALNFNYQNKDNMEMIEDLGRTFARIAQHVPGGMLVFFPSYWLMEKVYETWDRSGVLDSIQRHKIVYREPKNAQEYQMIMDRYYTAIFEDEESTGAILMGVCRGRISEGLDFSDKAARCVIVVGIPYPQITDPKVILKKEFLDNARSLQIKNRDQIQGLTGKDWYNQQATRSINQAIGRVIRHAQDYGAILLFDERYNYPSNRSNISRWLRDRIKTPQSYDQLDLQLRAFYKSMACKGFKPKVEQLEQVKITFDDANSMESQGPMPNALNSKDKYGNQGRVFTRKRKSNYGGKGGKLGFQDAQDDEENKYNTFSKVNMYEKQIFRPVQQYDASNDSDNGPTLVNGQLTITKMAKQQKDKQESEAKKRMISKLAQSATKT